MNRLLAVIKEYGQDEDLNLIKACQKLLLELYPGLHLRWVRVYGKRWAYLYGNSGELGNHSPLKIQLNENYGLCIDNSELIPSRELEQITTIIGKYFTGRDKT